MLDKKLIDTLELSLREMRNAQNRMVARLHDAENEVVLLRQEIGALESSMAQTEITIDRLLLSMHSGSRAANVPRSMRIDDEYEINRSSEFQNARAENESATLDSRPNGKVAYFSQHRKVPSISRNAEPISDRFSDRTITQACTLLLRESGASLHVNELYNLLIAGGMKFKGNNPTISIAVSLNRNSRFRKVDPGTFDLVMREAIKVAS